MISGRNIVCVASNYFEHPTSKQHIMRRLARHNRVLWINFHASRRPSLNRHDLLAMVRRLRQCGAGPRQADDGIDVRSPLLLPLPEARSARRFNAWRLERLIRRRLQELPPAPLQIWLFTPDVPELLTRLPAERVVYYCVDDFAAFSGFNTALVERLEAQTIAASDVVIATSPALYAARRRQHDNVRLLPHGVDYERFARAVELPPEQRPRELCSVPRPIFGYFGLLSDYVDLPLLAAVARRRPDWSFVLLGRSTCDLGGLAGLDNVHVLGARPYDELPAYCAGFDVGVIPFQMNRLVRAVNPIKLREYLAAGLPVVSAPMEAVRPYAAAVYFAETVEEFLEAGERALRLARQQPAAARQALVAEDGWDARVRQLSAWVLADADPDEVPPAPARSLRPACAG